jgi:hypothetical protein
MFDEYDIPIWEDEGMAPSHEEKEALREMFAEPVFEDWLEFVDTEALREMLDHAGEYVALKMRAGQRDGWAEVVFHADPKDEAEEGMESVTVFIDYDKEEMIEEEITSRVNEFRR